MIVEVGKIVDNEFIIITEVKEGTKMYLIGEDKFISRLKNEEWKLDNNLISDMISDGVLVASLVSELKELENTHILTYIVDMYLREHKIEKVRDLILKALSNVKVN